MPILLGIEVIIELVHPQNSDIFKTGLDSVMYFFDLTEWLDPNKAGEDAMLTVISNAKKEFPPYTELGIPPIIIAFGIKDLFKSILTHRLEEVGASCCLKPIGYDELINDEEKIALLFDKFKKNWQGFERDEQGYYRFVPGDSDKRAQL